jgi:formylglycine-generating enzyme required for sulfatase activity
VATEQRREPVPELATDLEESLETIGDACLQGDDQRVCIPGGATIVGTSELTIYPDLPPLPERIAIHEPFLVDRHEVTVARFREALTQGFMPPEMPFPREGPFGATIDTMCSWSSADQGRQDYALSCVSWQTARAFCQFFGGDLPTEAQWEHLATRASVNGRSRYPWGDEPPSCERAVHGRWPLAGVAGVCEYLGTGPLPEGAQPADVTPDGVIGAAGGVHEWMRDSYQDYRAACWGDSPITNPGCFEDNPTQRAIRGGSWAAPPTILSGSVRLGVDANGDASFIGFRCIYPVIP